MVKKVRVCRSRTCDVFDSEKILKKIEKETNLKAGESNDTIDLDTCGCLGYCHRSPNVAIDDNNIIYEAGIKTVMEEIESGGEAMDIQDKDVDNILQQYS
ncbi:MAG: (2Fe-2S) ferredoxin domain-containing protein [Candidatus Magasanikbacteria bacterium]